MGHHGNSFLSFGGVAGPVGGWIELGRTTLGSSNATIDVTSLSDKRYLMVLCNSVGVSAGANTGTQLNADTGSNYAKRGSNNGASDITSTTVAFMEAGGTSTQPYFQVGYLANVATKEKLLLSHLIAGVTSGAGTAPFRNESVGKHAQTTNPISSYQWITTTAATFDTGSQCVVLGWDPSDTHTANFWEPLADVDLSTGVSDVIDSGIITAKKYLWIQAYVTGTSGSEASFRLGKTSLDSGSNYAERFSSNGGTDVTTVNQTSFENFGTATPIFYNIFIINNTSNEKLMIMHGTRQSTAGAGNAPNRFETVGKWVNTSNQSDIVGFVNLASGNFEKKSFLKVWGSN